MAREGKRLVYIKDRNKLAAALEGTRSEGLREEELDSNSCGLRQECSKLIVIMDAQL